jgi:hypothetical protein
MTARKSGLPSLVRRKDTSYLERAALREFILSGSLPTK